MKIVAIDSFIARLKLGTPLKMAGTLITHSENLFVKITSDKGHIGWGESASAPNMTGEIPAGMLGAVRFLSRILLNQEFISAQDLLSKMDQPLLGNYSAKSAIETAFLDAQARDQDIPVHQLLGKQRREKIAALIMVAGGGTRNDAQVAANDYADGWRSFKVKVGMDTPANDAARTISVLQAVGKDAMVCADANRGYTFAQSLEYVELIKGHGLNFFEQPMASDQDHEWKELSTKSTTPIGIDETLKNVHVLNHFMDHQLAQGGSFKAIKFGGLNRVVEAGIVADAKNFKINLACKVAETSIASAAALHIAAVLPNLDWGISLTHEYLDMEYASQPLSFIHGLATIPTGPGLGIEVNESALRAMAVHEKDLF